MVIQLLCIYFFPVIFMASVCAQPIQGPKSHVIFESSSSEGGDGPLAIQAFKDAAAQRDPNDDDDSDKDYRPEGIPQLHIHRTLPFFVT